MRRAGGASTPPGFSLPQLYRNDGAYAAAGDEVTNPKEVRPYRNSMDNDDRHAELTARFDRIDTHLDALARGMAALLKGERNLTTMDQRIIDALALLSTDIDAALAANGNTAGLVQQLADANAKLAAMQAEEDAEPAALAALQKTADDATAALAANIADVTAALGGLDAKVKGGAAPAPATTPAPAV